MNRTLGIIFALLLAFSATGAELDRNVFSLLDLNRKGLEKVKALYQEGKETEAAGALLNYFRERKGIIHPDVNLEKVSLTETEQKWADEALAHKFFAHKGYQPSYWYGDDINWAYWPVKDNELRWQLHRHKWFVPLGKAYWLTKDEKYFLAWQEQYLDWISKNPLATDAPKGSAEEENVRFAWRPLEVSHRLQEQIEQLLYFIGSDNFTPEFLTSFLVNYHRHADRIIHNYSEKGNHLLFEAQRLYYAGTFFPEFNESETWKKSAVEVLNRESQAQVFDDGVQYELDLHYHVASINIFSKALRMAAANHSTADFPAEYISRINRMITALYNLSFPDYTRPLFGDAKKSGKAEMIGNYQEWAKIFPEEKMIAWLASEGKKGATPAYLSHAFPDGGFFTFRNSWNSDATVMVVKAGPPAYWHNQPDNGTFELWINGRNFFPDAGSYVYAGDEEVMKLRNWFRQTAVHNTLTLDRRDLVQTDSQTLLWKTGTDTEILVTENQSYENLSHRRSLFFVDKKFFVIVDEAFGTDQGNVAIHYQLCEGKMKLNLKEHAAATRFNDGNNLFLKSFSPDPVVMAEQEGWVSYEYRQRAPRKAFSFSTEKRGDQPVRFITVIYPVKNRSEEPRIEFNVNQQGFSSNGLNLDISVNGRSYRLAYQLPESSKK